MGVGLWLLIVFISLETNLIRRACITLVIEKSVLKARGYRVDVYQ